MAVVAFSITITEPELIKNYASYMEEAQKASKKQANKLTYMENMVERSLSRYYKATTNPAAAKNAALVPDLSIDSPRIAQALAKSFGADIEDVVDVEAKYRRGGSSDTTIGQRSASVFSQGFLDQLKLMARQSEEEGLLAKSKDFGGKGIDTYDVNNPAEVLRAVRAKIGGSGFFNLVAKYDPDLHKAFYNKAKNLLITEAIIIKGKVTGIKAVNIFFPFKDFQSPPFISELGKGSSIRYKLSDSFESTLIKRLEETGPPIVTNNVEEFTKILDSISGRKKLGRVDFASAPPLDYELQFGVPTGGSIPRVTGKVKRGNYVRKEKEDKESTTRLISSAQLTTILQNRIENKMPKFGPANPTEGLKYRTGRFVNSLQFTIDYKKQLISYFANPPVSEYFDKFHSRPYAVGQRLIRPTIRKTVQELFGRQFRIIKT